MKPSEDPTCQKYIDDPNRIWWSSRWFTREQIDKQLEARRRYKAKPGARDRENTTTAARARKKKWRKTPQGRAADERYWQRRGYLVHRMRELTKQRARIQNELTELAQEARRNDGTL